MISSMKKSPKRILRNIIIVILAVTMSAFVLTKVIYDSSFPRYDPVESSLSEISDEALLELVFSRREMSFSSGENELAGYLYAGRESKAVVVLAPGYRSSADDYLCQIKSLVDFGWGVFAFDTTGSCSSGGGSSVGFTQELLDLEAALEYIESNNNFGYDKLMLFGHSRGGYAVCCAPGFGHEIAAVVSVSGINSTMEGVIEPAEEYIGPLAYGNYPLLWLYQSMLFGRKYVNADAADILSKSGVPSLIIHASEDETVSSERYSVYAHRDDITSDEVEYLLWSGDGNSGHTNLLFDGEMSANDGLMETINQFYAGNVK